MTRRYKLAASVAAVLAAGAVTGGVFIANASPTPTPGPSPTVVDTPEPGDAPDVPGVPDLPEPGDTPDWTPPAAPSR